MSFLTILLLIFIITVVLFYTNETAHFYLMHLIIYTFMTFSLNVTLPLMILRGRCIENGNLSSWIGAHMCKSLGFSWEIRGLENIDDSQGNVLVLNHQSGVDFLIVAVLWNQIKNFTGLMKKEILYMPVFGPAFWYMNCFFVARSNKAQSKHTVSETAIAIKEDKFKIAYFTEGTRNDSGKLLPFKLGAFHAALEAQCPVQPIVISKQYFFNSKKKIFYTGHMIIEVLPAISTENLKKEEVRNFADKCKTLMQNKFDEISAELLKKHKCV